MASLELAPATAVLGVGDTLRLLATARDAEGRALVYRAFRWSSSDTTVASVDWTGLVTGLALGSSEIVASREGVSDTATIEVVEGVVAYLFITPESAR
ncbi:MAG: Ig-like domain-containing protein, partial [Gemmatimonadota bacterium]